MNRATYIGKSSVSLENGREYKYEVNNDSFGKFYSVIDESGELYRYSAKFFEDNFKM